MNANDKKKAYHRGKDHIIQREKQSSNEMKAKFVLAVLAGLNVSPLSMKEVQGN